MSQPLGPDPLSPKACAMRDLQAARKRLMDSLDFSPDVAAPGQWAREQLKRNPALLAALGGSAGLLLARLFRPSRSAKFYRDKKPDSGQKNGLVGLLMGPALTMLRQEALRQAASWVAQWAAQRAERQQAPSQSAQSPFINPDRNDSHV